jgi:hypothetical protein
VVTVQEVAELVEAAVQDARTPVLPRADSLTVQDLLDLWHGDEHSHGYAHPLIARAICRIVKPRDIEILCTKWIYPELPYNRVPPRGLKLVALGWHLFDKERRALPE